MPTGTGASMRPISSPRRWASHTPPFCRPSRTTPSRPPVALEDLVRHAGRRPPHVVGSEHRAWRSSVVSFTACPPSGPHGTRFTVVGEGSSRMRPVPAPSTGRPVASSADGARPDCPIEAAVPDPRRRHPRARRRRRPPVPTRSPASRRTTTRRRTARRRQRRGRAGSTGCGPIPPRSSSAASIVVWCIVFGRLIWQRHARFATFDFDLGHHDQAIWLLSQGKGFITVSGMPVFGHHLTLAYFAVAPLYWLGGGPQLLDLLQTAALGLSAVPIYLLRPRPPRQRVAGPRPRRGVAAQPVRAMAVLGGLAPRDDGHPVPPHRLPAGHPAAVAAGTGSSSSPPSSWKEDVAIAVAILGIVFAVRGERRVGLATLALGVVWFLVAYGVVMPHFNGGTNQAGIFYGELGQLPRRPRPHDADRSRPGHRPAARQRRARLRPRPAGAVRVPPAARACAARRRRAAVLRQHPHQRQLLLRHPLPLHGDHPGDARPGDASKVWPGCGWPGCAGSASARRRVGAGDVGRLGCLAAQHALPHRLLAARRATPARTSLDDAVASVPGRRRGGGDVLHRPAPQPPRPDLHVPQPVDPGQLGRRRRRTRTTPTATTCRRRSSGSSSTAPPTARGHGRSSCSTICSTNGEFEVVSDREGIVVARRVAPPARRNRDLGALGLEIETDRAQMAGARPSAPRSTGSRRAGVSPAGGGRRPAPTARR